MFRIRLNAKGRQFVTEPSCGTLPPPFNRMVRRHSALVRFRVQFPRFVQIKQYRHTPARTCLRYKRVQIENDPLPVQPPLASISSWSLTIHSPVLSKPEKNQLKVGQFVVRLWGGVGFRAKARE